MFGCYRKGDANDPDTYCAAVSAVLAQYPPDIVRRVTDPRTGLPGQSDWLPTVKEVRDACEEIIGREKAKLDREANAKRQLAERAELDEFYANQPKVSLQERHGPNYGLRYESEKETDAARTKRREILTEANKRVFAAECKDAGLPENSLISPSLMRLLKSATTAP